MRQMINKKAPSVREAMFVDLECAVYRFRGGDGRIYLASLWGNCVVSFPILEDGRVSNHGVASGPARIVEVLNPTDLGFSGNPEWTEEMVA